MAGLMSRTSAVVKAWISKLLDRAEDPSVTLDYSYEKQREQLQNVKRGVADVVTAKKRLELQAQKLEQDVVKLESQAREALAAGREDLARAALERKALAQQQLQGLDQQAADLEAQQEKLIEAEKRLAAKVEAFRSQKEVIKAQYSAAEAQVRIGEAATGIGEEMADTGLAIERARDKTEQMQARASAVEELTAAGTLEDLTSTDTQLDRELAQLSASRQVDDELAKLKGELGAGREAEGARGMIVRLMGEGQYRVDEALFEQLSVLDDAAEAAAEAGDEAQLDANLDRMWTLVRESGERLADDELTPSEAVIPPSDLTLEETRRLMAPEGFIPDIPNE